MTFAASYKEDPFVFHDFNQKPLTWDDILLFVCSEYFVILFHTNIDVSV